MKCPTCNAWATIKETRARPDETTRRRYECANLHRFTTIERVMTEEEIQQYKETRLSKLLVANKEWKEQRAKRRAARKYV